MHQQTNGNQFITHFVKTTDSSLAYFIDKNISIDTFPHVYIIHFGWNIIQLFPSRDYSFRRHRRENTALL